MKSKHPKMLPTNSSPTQFLLYKTPDGKVKIDFFLQDNNVWLTQAKIATLFNVGRPAITKHLINIFKTNELDENSVCSILEHTADDGKIYPTKFYNLETILAIGYRVNSIQATHFRMWATEVSKSYVIKGFAMDDERLKQGTRVFGQDYFQELLERVRSIRASERRIYQKITDIFAECSTDYNPKSATTQEFYAMVQNKFHFAITGKTAAEIIYTKANAQQPHMGLTTWKNGPQGRILSSDTTVAKNYLQAPEIKKLERTITAFFDYIETHIERQETFTMQAFSKSVDKFLHFNEYKVLEKYGKIKKSKADKKALDIYKQYNKHQSINSDFDKSVKKLLANQPHE